jgi:hypothetical protein
MIQSKKTPDTPGFLQAESASRNQHFATSGAVLNAQLMPAQQV